MVGELLKIIAKMREEIEGLSEHGDIPNDSYKDLTKSLEEMEAIIIDFAQ